MRVACATQVFVYQFVVLGYDNFAVTALKKNRSIIRNKRRKERNQKAKISKGENIKWIRRRDSKEEGKTNRLSI